MNKEIIDQIEKINNDPESNKPLSDEQYNEFMKITSNDIDIAKVKFRLSTARRIAKDFKNILEDKDLF